MLSLLLLGLSGCATMDNANQYTMVLTEETPLLESGPNQSTPPSAILPAGTRVRILSGSGASAYIETVGHQKGFVSTHSLKSGE